MKDKILSVARKSLANNSEERQGVIVIFKEDKVDGASVLKDLIRAGAIAMNEEDTTAAAAACFFNTWGQNQTRTFTLFFTGNFNLEDFVECIAPYLEEVASIPDTRK